MNVLYAHPKTKTKTKEAFTMENKKDKVALNDDLLDKISGGSDDFRPTCEKCGANMDYCGNCTNRDCANYLPSFVPNAEYPDF